jgi:hypothetical protein
MRRPIARDGWWNYSPQSVPADYDETLAILGARHRGAETMSTRLTILRRGDGAFARCDCCGEPAREVEAAVRILCSGCGRYLCEACSRQCRHAAQDHRHVGIQ